ncbi:MAG: ThuA domain-containing protein [Verrucomicrobiota bacterium]
MNCGTFRTIAVALTVTSIALGFCHGQDKEIRLQDYIDDPTKLYSWKKTIPDGWKMQQGICERRIEHHMALYGAQVLASVPDEPVFPPKKPRQLLVLQMFFHDDTSGMQGTFLAALESMAEKTAAFEIKVIPTLTDITRNELFAFDAVVVNGANYSLVAESIDPEKLYTDETDFRVKSCLRYHYMFEKTAERRAHGNAMRQALLEYVNAGGGLVGIGAAPRSAWPAYRRMFGCTDTEDYGLVIGEKEPKTLLTDLLEIRAAEKNPLTQMLPEEGALTVSSGLFVPDREFFERSSNQVLLSIDVASSQSKLRKQLSPKTEWEDSVPATWARNQGDGRVFYASFECSGRFMMNREIQNHILGGIQYAVGDQP